MLGGCRKRRLTSAYTGSIAFIVALYQAFRSLGYAARAASPWASS